MIMDSSDKRFGNTRWDDFTLTVRCRSCGAGPGRPCTTEDGSRRSPHGERFNDVAAQPEPMTPDEVSEEIKSLQRLLDYNGIDRYAFCRRLDTIMHRMPGQQACSV